MSYQITRLVCKLGCVMGLACQMTFAFADQPVVRTVESLLKEQIQPLMLQYQIEGMAVGVVHAGQVHTQYFGYQSARHKRKVDEHTLFELGSVSKLFTATAGAYAQQMGKIRWTDSPARHWSALANSQIARVNLLQLATYTTGNLPLQFPDHVRTEQDVLNYFQTWTAKDSKGLRREYSNPSIGLFGALTARAFDQDFQTLMQDMIFPKLGLAHSFIHVPQSQQPYYAFGHDATGRMIRVNAGPLDGPAYGIKAALPDVLHFAGLNLSAKALEQDMQHAISATQQAYFALGEMQQGLGWEVFAYPTTLDTLLYSNTEQIVLKPNPVQRVKQQFPEKVLHKTGSTNGFGTYVLVIPKAQFAFVMLMNKKIPNTARIEAAYRLFEALQSQP